MNYDYAIHSDFLIHWTGKDIDQKHDKEWFGSNKSLTNKSCDDAYLERIRNTLDYGLWMTEGQAEQLIFGDTSVIIPTVPKTCFTELNLAEMKTQAKQYGRLGIGVRRHFVFNRRGRPVIYYGFNSDLSSDEFLRTCATKLNSDGILNFFKFITGSTTISVRQVPIIYDFYREAEWRIIYLQKLRETGLIIDPADPVNKREYKYFKSLSPSEQKQLKYLIPLKGTWFAMIIYPSLALKAKSKSDRIIRKLVSHIKPKMRDDQRCSLTTQREDFTKPIETDLDSYKDFRLDGSQG
jgi:hypothetical protein